MVDPVRLFGEPRRVGFRLGQSLRIVLERRGDGTIEAIRFAPREGLTQSEPSLSDGKAINDALEALVPGIAVINHADDPTAFAKGPRLGQIHETRRSPGFVLTRSYQGEVDVGHVVSAELRIDGPDVEREAGMLVANLGVPEYRRFVSPAGMVVDVVDDPARGRSVEISAPRPIHDSCGNPERQLDEADVEALVRQMVPAGNAILRGLGRFQSGGIIIKRFVLGDVGISYNYLDGTLCSVSLSETGTAAT